jgi:hypothetical protein
MYQFIVIRFHSLVRQKKKKKTISLEWHQADLLSPNLVCMIPNFFKCFSQSGEESDERGGGGVYSEWAQFYEPRKSSSCRVAEKRPQKQIFFKHV